MRALLMGGFLVNWMPIDARAFWPFRRTLWGAKPWISAMKAL